MLNLHLNAREDERFHLQTGAPTPHVTRFLIGKRIRWTGLFLFDGSPGEFVSWWLFGNGLHWYRGTAKIDGTRTRMYWWGQLDDGYGEKYVPDSTQYVVTTTPKEMRSVRFFVDPGEPTWDNMGGS